MSVYGKDSGTIEFGKWLVFKMGNMIGFAQPSLAALMGSFIWLMSWTVLPGSYRLLVDMPLLGRELEKAGVTPEILARANWGVVGLGTFLGLACWCRLAVLCNPDTFDRYKINIMR
ncbi:MAG: hypothetical protein PHE83_18505 [Opitutaceae bacterium]|nr:hypothetical protein [Opitutaceae bacterium]